MKVYRYSSLGSVDNLTLRDEAEPRPGHGQVVVRIRATALNFRDLLVSMNQYPSPLKPELIPVSDGAGEVVAVGEGVTRFKAGDRVVANFLQRWIGGPLKLDYLGSDLGGSVDGLLAECVVLSEEGLVRLPDYMSFEEGGSLACAGITAWAGLTTGAPLEAGQAVLVQGTGGVSIFALQFAKAFGCRVIATTSSAAKAERLRALGADHVVNYVETPNWDEKVRALTDGKGVDRVIEVGGPATMTQSVNSLAIGGRIGLVGFVAGFEGSFNPLQMLGRGLSIDAIAVGSRQHFEAMLQAMATHRIHPVIDRTFAFEDAKSAYGHLLRRGHIGKVMIAGA